MNDASENRLAPLWGLVLAGGRSRRFGRDKAAVKLNGETLLARSVNLIRPLVEEVFVSVRADQLNDPLRCHYQLLTDAAIGQGPAAGLLAAHAANSAVAWLVVACDLPMLDFGTLDLLVQSRRAENRATVFSAPADGRPEPLCAIYEPDALECFRQRTDAGSSLSPRDFLASLDVALVSTSSDAALMNLNTQADYSKLIEND
jgi:molybdopterin-guanine dinucleotide biosynthesis protein A